ncbi:MAG: hypothetical protein EOO24_45065 [Comamonadaceae bacterium]|nr:MAG: hypothetical protein EOO24_45065 [Comamonadaceae bacterium]
MIFARFPSGATLRSRSVSGVVLHARLDVPAPPARLWGDWERDVVRQLQLAPGDVEPLALARARARWPAYRQCVQQVADWTRTLGLGELLDSCDAALMACRGARYHHDAEQYGGAAFCNLFLGADRGLDLHFPDADVRIPLVRGTAVLFDTGQPHAVVPRGRCDFDAADFASDRDCTEVFLTWELPVEDVRVARALGIVLDVEPATPAAVTAACVPRSPSRPS